MSDDLFKEVWMATDVGMAAVNADGVLEEVNPAFEALAGPGLSGHPLSDVSPQALHKVNELFLSGASHGFAFDELLILNDKRFWGHWTGNIALPGLACLTLNPRRRSRHERLALFQEHERSRISKKLASLMETVKAIPGFEFESPLLDELRNLNPAGSLVPDLRALLQRFQEQTGIEAQLIVPDRAIELSSLGELCLFRVMQEALTNVRRHSEATRVLLAVTQAERGVVASLTDDGRGFVAGQRGMGLQGMRWRVELASGELSIDSEAGSGTRVTVRLP